MILTQISVFMENREGQLARITSLLSEKGLTLRAVSIAETKDYGILRLLADEPLKVAEALHENGFIYSESPIYAIRVSDAPGGLNDLLDKIRLAGVDVQYMYSMYNLADHSPYMMIRVADGIKLDEILSAK